ncbi:MAG: condensation domain-containing protein, partial [Actinoallomurus sp.]
MTDDLLERVRRLPPQQRKQLLDRLRTTRRETAVPAVLGPRDPALTDISLSPAQERLYFQDRLDPGNPAYVIPVTLRIQGTLDADALERALNAVVDRHEALRSVFVDMPSGPRQRVLSPARIGIVRVRPEPVSSLDADLGRHARVRLDLASGPPLDARLFVLGERDHVLQVVIHHIAFDGWSSALLVDELTEVYRAETERRTPHLAPLTVQYPDFALWARQRASGERFAGRLAEVCAGLSGAPLALNLPTDRPRPPVQTHNGGHLSFSIGTDATERLGELARAEGTTLYTALLSAFAVLLSTASGDEEIIIGTPVAGRTRAELEPMIGSFADILVIRTSPAGASDFREMLRRTHGVVRHAYAHQEVPYAKVVEKLAPPRDPSRNPLFQVMFGYADLDPAEGDGRTPTFTVESHDTGVTDFDLFLSMSMRDGQVHGELGYNTDLFHPASAADLAGRYRDLTSELASAPDVEWDQIPLLRGGTVAIAASFTADPVAPALQGWSRYLGLRTRVEFAPYGQVFQQLLDPGGVFGRNPHGANVVLLRWEDLLRHHDGGDDQQSALALLDRGLGDLRDALTAYRAWSAAALSILICPPSPAWSAQPWTGMFARLQERLARMCARLPDIRVGSADPPPATDYYDERSDQLASVPYTPAFFATLGTLIARRYWSIAVRGIDGIVLDTRQMPAAWSEGELRRLGAFLSRQVRHGREVALVTRTGQDLPGGLRAAADAGCRVAGVEGDGSVSVDVLLEQLTRRTSGGVVVLGWDAKIHEPSGVTAVSLPADHHRARTLLDRLWVLDPPVGEPAGLRPIWPSRIARTAESRSEPESVLGHLGSTRPAPPATGDVPFAEARTETERRLAALWCQALEVDRVGRTDNFFALGGHSLLAVGLLSRINAEFGRTVELYDLFSGPSVERLAQVIDAAEADHASGPVAVSRNGPLPVSSTQRRLWTLAKVHGPDARHNIAFSALLVGELDEPALRAAIATLVERHEVLRTTIVDHDGEPLLRVHPGGPAWSDQVFAPTVNVPARPARDEETSLLLDAIAAEPFDLERGPLIRVRLLATDPAAHHLSVVMHHAVSDNRSWLIFLDELARLYATARADRDTTLPALPLQFADYAHWQSSWLSTDRVEGLQRRWRELLADAPPLSVLPTDLPRSRTLDPTSGQATLRIGADLTDRLRAVGRRLEVPLFSVLLTGFRILVGHCTDQDSFVVGTPVANRDHADLAALMGDFADLLPIRLTVEPDLPIPNLVRATHQAILDSRALQRLPFENIVSAVRASRVAHHHPLFQTVVNFVDGDDETLNLTGLTVTPAPPPPGATDFDLFLSINAEGDGLLSTLEYASALYTGAGAAALLEALHAMFEAVAGQADTPSGQISLPEGCELPTVRPAPPIESGEPAGGNHVAIASGFTAEPLGPALGFWLELFGHERGVAFAPYAQVVQQLLDPDGVFATACGQVNVVLLRWEDWVRHTEIDRETRPNRLVQELERGFADLCEALAAHRSWCDTPLVLAVCPASAGWSTAPWPAIHRGFHERLVAFCAGLAEMGVLNVEQAACRYPVSTRSDEHADELAHIPYTPEFFTVLATVLARTVVAAHTECRSLYLAPTRLLGVGDGTPDARAAVVA